jgi:hypothetical protein
MLNNYEDPHDAANRAMIDEAYNDLKEIWEARQALVALVEKKSRSYVNRVGTLMKDYLDDENKAGFDSGLFELFDLAADQSPSFYRHSSMCFGPRG